MPEEQTGIYTVPDDPGPTDEATAYLFVLSGEDAGRLYKLEPGEYVLGRGTTANIRIGAEGVSRSHASVVLHGDGTMLLSDLGSTNGTFVNGERIESQSIHDGDQLRLGAATVIKFTREEDASSFERGLYQSGTHALTGVYNAQYFAEQLDKDFSFAVRRSSDLSVVMFVIDDFDGFIDRHGAEAGDAALRFVARLVAEAIRREDVLCRIDEARFAVIMRDSGTRDAYLFARRLQALVAERTFPLDGEPVTLTISLGAATLKPAIHADVGMLLHDVESYLADAVQRGPGGVAATLPGS